MNRSCEVCGTGYVASRASARYCSGKCRARASRQPKTATRPPLSAVPPLSPEQRAAASALEDITRSTLEDAGRDQTVLGQVALLIARRLDGPSTDTGSSIAALVKEHRAAMAGALEGTNRERSPLDLLRERSALRAGQAARPGFPA